MAGNDVAYCQVNLEPQMTTSEWNRVNRRRPCPVCGRPDWCLYKGPESAPVVAICARVESNNRRGDAGWLHLLGNDGFSCRPRSLRVRLCPPPTCLSHFGHLALECAAAITVEELETFAAELGLTTASLVRLGVGWSSTHNAWTWPMQDAGGNVIGIRLRLRDGRKLSVRGGLEGLFLPRGVSESLLATGALLITEGPTDCAAMLDMGFEAIGRPSCTGGSDHIVGLLRRYRARQIVVVSDSDEPGMRGAENLAQVLVAYGAVRVIRPPSHAKDVRAWRQAGATSCDIETAIELAPARKLQVLTRRMGRSR